MLFCSTWAWAYDCTVDWAMASGLGPLGILVSAQGSKSAGLNLAFGSITSGAEENANDIQCSPFITHLIIKPFWI